MAAISASEIETRRAALMTNTRCSVIVAKPEATDSTTPGVFKIKDPDPGDTANAVATEQGNAKGGSGSDPWKAFSYDDAGVAYNL